ncbi:MULTISPECIES: ABC transporter substrate-binding protein [Bradyrhizobium]|uniref:ABC transporter substrate-binding protein n=1 Tax=Bradyrhizobium TaxID=374 RepID=UPI0004B7C795|nr:ABC transporter substrate-binding protein [Bradyrhizobium elkanii]MCS3524508.1 ABC-type branched-subunit amino acid transport system substrate-binding protein [Bradyrhizobium elkanii]MCS4072164.1 ABC-type branched-subunit amino acid transport system substrate-binding protein [Bradyrhizobium elkanii]MCS4078797.1 ABC-type branched-subunit amino acid transport system substrate-binding protein [Bradyrhizobium elkanii]MCW2122604.1 ABC-type branched-subunit amino acid transport system substrate-bi
MRSQREAHVVTPVRRMGRFAALLVAGSFFALTVAPGAAQKKYDDGVTDSEIKIGNTTPYSGPASAYAVMGKTYAAYFQMINDGGGINGRKINFISYDDAYSPPKTVEQVRKLVESDQVFLIFAPLGTAPNAAIQKNLNRQRVPQLFVGSGASRWADPGHFPWTIGILPSYRSEARVYATYILKNYPDKKIGILFQNDDFGKDYLQGLKDVLGDKYRTLVVSEVSFEVTSPTVDSQVATIKAANPDIFIDLGAPKFTAQAIKKVAELAWHPIHIISNVSTSIAATLNPAGLDNSRDILSAGYLMNVSDPRSESAPGMKRFRAFQEKYLPNVDKGESLVLSAYNAAVVLIEVLRRCGDDLTRENVMKQVANLDLEVDTYLPGIRIKTSPTDFEPIEQLQMMKFDGSNWELFGPVIDTHRE